MANQQLIKGAGDLYESQGFYNVGEVVRQGIASAEATRSIQDEPSSAKRNQAYQNQVNKYMSKMKTVAGLDSFTPKETKAMRDFLLSQRSIYANAAKEAAKFDDTTDPNYMQYVDQMQNVNNSFTNLATQIKAYKQGKLNYAQSMQNGEVSLGTDNGVLRNNNIMYGFYDGDGDGISDARYNSPLSIAEGGNLAFNIDGQNVLYNDAQDPLLKDYELGLNIIKTNESIFQQGAVMRPSQLKMYEIGLQKSLQNVNSLKSLIYDFSDELPTNDLGNMWDAITAGSSSYYSDAIGSEINFSDEQMNIISNGGGVDLVRKEAINLLMQGYQDSAVAGKKEADAKKWNSYSMEEKLFRTVFADLAGQTKLSINEQNGGKGVSIQGLEGIPGVAYFQYVPDLDKFVVVNENGIRAKRKITDEEVVEGKGKAGETVIITYDSPEDLIQQFNLGKYN